MGYIIMGGCNRYEQPVHAVVFQPYLLFIGEAKTSAFNAPDIYRAWTSGK
jgi:hypothetical protein